MQSLKNFYWPSMDDLWSAKKACIQSASGAILISVVTAAVSFLQLRNVSLVEDLSGASFLDAALFGVLGFFIYRCSRLANIAAFGLHVAGQVLAARFSFLGVIIALFFLNGIRGSFAYHEMKQGMSKEEIKATLKEQKETTEPYVSPAKKITAWVILAAIVIGLIIWYNSNESSSKSSSGSGTAEIVDANPAAKTAAVPAGIPSTPAPSGDQRSFKLKNGKTVTGTVTMDDPDYYTVETAGGKQEIVIKEDIAA